MKQRPFTSLSFESMKKPTGVGVEPGLVHTVTTAAANVGAVMEVDKLLHGQEKMVYADAGFQGAERRAPKYSHTVVHRDQARQRRSDEQERTKGCDQPPRTNVVVGSCRRGMHKRPKRRLITAPSHALPQHFEP